jgi:hypothetical protein
MTSWIVFFLLALFLVYNQVRAPFPVLLSIVSAYYLFVGARFTISMIDISLTEESVGSRVFAGIISLLGIALVVVALYGHFRQLRAMRVFFWVAIVFALASIKNLLMFAGEGSSQGVMQTAVQLMVWIGIVLLSHHLSKHPEKLSEAPAGATADQQWMW